MGNLKRQLSGLVSSHIAIAILLLLAPFHSKAFAWGNGGFSSDPDNPDYGAHDWIAHHALDWLPYEEKWYILAHLKLYLYATELPDNAKAIDGIGDVVKHHVYYRKDGSLQDDASAKRADEYYQQALATLKVGNLAGAVKASGIMGHYISDLAVFGHVMGRGTDWGPEVHHDDYEDYVDVRTRSYNSPFNASLKFDGEPSTIKAYDAALKLAYDTTFDPSGRGLTAVWMDAHYDWSDPTFRGRAEESLNLAVNLLADVLHTVALEASLEAPAPAPQPEVTPKQVEALKPEAAAPEAPAPILGILILATLLTLLGLLSYRVVKRRGMGNKETPHPSRVR